MTTEQVAQYLGVKPGLLRAWRNRRIGPPYKKFPGKVGAVLYHEADVVAFLGARIVQTERMPMQRSGQLPKPFGKASR